MGYRFKPRGTWRGKLEKEQEPKVVDVPAKWAPRFGTGKMLVPTPLLVDALVRKIEYGRLVTVEQMRGRLARDFNVGSTCPLTTGIFIRIAAEAAEEDRQMGKNEVTPYWRVIRDDGSLNEKLPGGAGAQSQRLKEEGHIVEPGRGKKPPRVKEYEKRLVEL